MTSEVHMMISPMKQPNWMNKGALTYIQSVCNML